MRGNKAQMIDGNKKNKEKRKKGAQEEREIHRHRPAGSSTVVSLLVESLLAAASGSRPQSRFDHRRIFSLPTLNKKRRRRNKILNKKKRPSSRESQFECVVPCRPCALSLSLCVCYHKTCSFLSKYLHPRVSCLCVCVCVCTKV